MEIPRIIHSRQTTANEEVIPLISENDLTIDLQEKNIVEI